jgi:phosphomevalonate kinase
MNRFVASAPGKVFLSGEYAVLEGAPAILAAIDRRATAREGKGEGRLSPVIDAVAREIAQRWPDLVAGAHGSVRISVRTPGFTRGRAKLGLGSSAAVAAAATALLLARVRNRIDLPPREIFEIALAAHTRAQGGRGSGADVAAAVYGGAISYRSGADVERLGSLPVATAFAWTGRSASTIELVSRVQEFAAHAPQEHRALSQELASLARELAAAYARGAAAEIVRLTAAYGLAMGRLGEAAGAPIVTEVHARIASIAASHGGAGKPSGAGGGDLAMAVFERPGDRDRFCEELEAERIPIVELRCGGPGVALSWKRPHGAQEIHRPL